eukprot:CAMPEP_0113454706 /NCGR_PEP_ID=MMETSP0014_2-20120614/8002_1 /TAXON_ID=2857 /ORGANISM="Nitzschia sp." /LENGTH=867 /DNA_ID=CAMNT_0000346121 /DNA_START=168 /DNA_END=2771 /DNA_ORIENTATION=- /assembly_acc=CAM_ASM_000159
MPTLPSGEFKAPPRGDFKGNNDFKVDFDPAQLEYDDVESSILSDEDDDDISVSSITPMMKRSWVMIVLVLVLGIGGGIAFIVLGVQNERAYSTSRFETRATQLAKDISQTVQEYETAAKSVHNVCSRRETTRQQFRQFYEYLTSGGLQVQATQCAPNVTHEERLTYELSAKLYYDEFYPTTVNYTGFKGWEYDAATDSYPLVPSRAEAPFYFPVDMSEPVVPNAGALGLDTYSHPFQRKEIEQALTTHQPILGGRLKLVQETEENAYTVIMRHPGIKTASYDSEVEDLDQVPQELGVVLIRIPSLLKRRGDEQKESIACYLYDITPDRTQGVETYLGAAEYDAKVMNDTIVTDVRIPPNDLEYEDVISSYKQNCIFETTVSIASNAQWKLVVTPVQGDSSFDPLVAELVFGGSMIIFCTLCLSLFLWRNMNQVKMIHRAKNQAEAERRIIASLYPENVVERLLDDERNKQQAEKERVRNKGKPFEGKVLPVNDHRDASIAKTADSIEGSSDSNSQDNTPKVYERKDSRHGDPKEGGALSIFGTDPIAHHYEETTILFMDMVGFTAWSRTREPKDVFTLLENTYSAFDVLAKRRRVFKVETVGDCYVAVVGLPDPRKNHAAVMAQFASSCLEKMSAVMNELAPTLGEDTKTLSLRAGLCSGPVTGGVLRGEKGRFQLFGDTMNTAARMESNGKPGKIHVSPTTAACLRKSGKGRWLIPRDDTINAKGIGEMKTFWVKVSSSLSRHSSMDSSYDYETGSQHGASTDGSWKPEIRVTDEEPVVDNNNSNNHQHGGADRDSWAPGIEMGHPDEPADYTTNLDRDREAHSTPSSAADIVTNARLIQQQNHVARKVGKKVPPPRSTMEHMLTM